MILSTAMCRAILACLLVTITSTDGHASKLIDLGTLGGIESSAFFINDAGDIVGESKTLSGETHAFLYRNGLMTDLGTLGGDYSSPTAMNGNGQVVGSSTTVDGKQHAFLYSDGVMIDLGTLGGSASRANGINDSGQIVGGAQLAGDHASHAFLYSAGVMADLGTLGGTLSTAIDINESGEIVGRGWTSGDTENHPFLYSAGGMVDLGTLGGTDGSAHAINNVGQVIGWMTRPGSYLPHAFLYSGGTMIDLEMFYTSWFPVHFSSATAINSSGQVIGNMTGDAGPRYGLVSFGYSYDEGVLESFSWEFCGSELNAINDVGQVVVTGCGAYVNDSSDGSSHSLGTLGGRFDDSIHPYSINNSGRVVGSSTLTLPGYSDYKTHAFLLACHPTPLETCLPARWSSLLVRKGGVATKDLIKWKWLRGGVVTQANLGDPRTDTPYTLCIYDSTNGDDHLVDSLRIDPNAAWSDENPKGWSYSDRDGRESGVTLARLKTGTDGKSSVRIAAQGTNILLSEPFNSTSFFDQSDRVTVQMFNDSTSTCWTSEFTTALANDGVEFKALSRLP